VSAMVASSVAGFREGDWMCPSCNNHNYSSKAACNRCGTPKPDAHGSSSPVFAYGAPNQTTTAASQPGFRAGDWMCPQCGNHNYSSKVACNRCGAPKAGQHSAPSHGAYLSNAYDKVSAPAPTARASPYGGKGAAPAKPNGAASGTGMRPGDWCCPACYSHNYASKMACFKCGAPKIPQMHGPVPGGAMGNMAAMAGMQNGAGGQGAKRPGDWTCYGCGNNNYASRTEACNRCGLPKTVFVSKSGMRPGDWVCTSCHNHNWADRTSCMKCGTPKGSSQVNTKGMKPGDWLCTQCSNHNYSGKDRCHRCQSPKQPGAITVSA